MNLLTLKICFPPENATCLGITPSFSCLFSNKILYRHDCGYLCLGIQAVLRMERLPLELPLSLPDLLAMPFIKAEVLVEVKGRFSLLSLAKELSTVTLIWTSVLQNTGVTCEFVMLSGKCFGINESDEILMKHLFFYCFSNIQ